MRLSEDQQHRAITRWKRVRQKDLDFIHSTQNLFVEKAAICGFLAGDGCISQRHYGQERSSIRFYPDDELMRDTYVELIQKVYNRTPICVPQKGHYKLEVAHRAVAEDIIRLGKFGIKKWEPPQFVYESDETKVAWLRAFFSAEGYVGEKSIRVQTVNERGMQAISAMLTSLGITHGCYKYKPKNPQHSTVFIVTILKLEARLQYAEIVGFWHGKKFEKLSAVLKSASQSNV